MGCIEALAVAPACVIFASLLDPLDDRRAL